MGIAYKTFLFKAMFSAGSKVFSFSTLKILLYFFLYLTLLWKSDISMILDLFRYLFPFSQNSAYFIFVIHILKFHCNASR